MTSPALAALNEAIADAGSQAAFAAALDVSQPTVTGWKNAGRAPEARCPAIEALFGVPCERLRPDLKWTRDGHGNVTGYHVQLGSAA